MTLNDALILSYVKRGIGYGYNILTHVRESRSDEWVEFSRAGLYKTLVKLELAGCIRKTLEQTRGRPPRNVYRITAAGERALAAFLENGFKFEYVDRHEFDAYLVIAVAAAPDAETLAVTIARRSESVKQQIKELELSWPSDKTDYPFIVYALYQRRMESLRNEHTWLAWLAETVQHVGGDILHMTWGDVKR